jgi:hypothetical protein
VSTISLRLPAEGRLCENENFKKKVFGAPQFCGAGSKAEKTQRPPEVIPSDHNFFAPLRLCEKIEKRIGLPAILRGKQQSREGEKASGSHIGKSQEARNQSREVDYNFFAPRNSTGQVFAR